MELASKKRAITAYPKPGCDPAIDHYRPRFTSLKCLANRVHLRTPSEVPIVAPFLPNSKGQAILTDETRRFHSQQGPMSDGGVSRSKMNYARMPPVLTSSPSVFMAM